MASRALMSGCFARVPPFAALLEVFRVLAPVGVGKDKATVPGNRDWMTKRRVQCDVLASFQETGRRPGIHDWAQELAGATRAPGWRCNAPGGNPASANNAACVAGAGRVLFGCRPASVYFTAETLFHFRNVSSDRFFNGTPQFAHSLYTHIVRVSNSVRYPARWFCRYCIACLGCPIVP